MNTSQLNKVINTTIQECLALRESGQKEYAHEDDNVFRNFIESARKLNLTKEQVLYIFADKHWSGVAAWIKGHKSQRENVRGRINDMIVYLWLLRGMVDEDENVFNQATPMTKEIKDKLLITMPKGVLDARD